MKYKTIKLILIVLAFAIMSIGAEQFFVLRKAHSTFENYYVFRGCAQLLEKTDDFGVCKASSGETIKIVKIQDKWYLENDGPGFW